MSTADSLDQILSQLDEVRAGCPELRFGQMIATIGMLAEDETGLSLWDVEDADFAAALARFAADMERREASNIKPGPTEKELIDALPADLQSVYLEMRTRAMAFGPDVETYATRKNLVFKARKVFAEIQRRKASLRVLIRPEGFNIPENSSAQVYGVTVTRVPDTHLWTVNHKLEVDCNSPMDSVEKLLRQSYEAAVGDKAGRNGR
jgi:predicted transport protein